MDLFEPVKKLYKSLTGEKEKEELLLLLQEWDALLRATTNRIEGLEKGYEFLRRGMFLRSELEGWRRLALVSIVLSVLSFAGIVYLLLVKGR